MNLLDALSIVRNCAMSSHQLSTKQGQTALKVVNKKIASLSRKKEWRTCGAGEMPAHMRYPDHPLNSL